MNIITVVERIQSLPHGFVDSNFGQGHNLALKQLSQRRGQNAVTTIDSFIRNSQRGISALIQSAKPYELPEDYIFFLETYGGLTIWPDNYDFFVLGVGPMVEEWYGAIDGDGILREPGKHGFAELGMLCLPDDKYKLQNLSFFLDISGTIQKNSVISVGPWGEDTVPPDDVIKNLKTYIGMWQKVADSFTEWLHIAAETKGGFGYNENA